MKFKKGDKVVWRASSGFCTQEYEGEVDRIRRDDVRVIFRNDLGQIAYRPVWFRSDELVLMEKR